MRVKTTRFGEIEIDEDKVIHFPRGFPGFEGLERFILLDYREPIKWLQSLDDPNIAFIVTDPFLFFSDYSFIVDDATESFLEIGENTDVIVLMILNMTEDGLTANLKAPIVINGTLRKGVQVLLDDGRYDFRIPLPQIQKNAK